MALRRIHAWGYNAYGGVGDGTTQDKTSPVTVEVPVLPRKLVGGGRGEQWYTYESTFAVGIDGSLWSWGANNRGQLGDGTQTSRTTPGKLEGLPAIIDVSSEYGHTLAVAADGTVLAWGANDKGELGDGTTQSRLSPILIPSLSEVVAVSAGGGVNNGYDVIADAGGHSLALRADGSVWAWGWNSRGQLGDGTTVSKPVPTKVEGLDDIVAIAASRAGWRMRQPYLGAFSLALRSDGTVWAWGNNYDGQMGVTGLEYRLTPDRVPGLEGIVAISAGAGHGLALREDGTVWAWGRNAEGQLGIGNLTNQPTPVEVVGLDGIVAIAAGERHSLAVREDGTVWGWGYNSNGQLGDGSTASRTLPVQVADLIGPTMLSAAFHSLALDATLGLIFASPDGYRLTSHFFGAVVAGGTLGPVGVDLYNGSGSAVGPATVRITEAEAPDVVEISRTANPFIPEDPVVFSGTHQPEEKIGTLYVRIRPDVRSGGLRQFQLRAQATPV